MAALQAHVPPPDEDVRSPGERTFSGLQMDFGAILPTAPAERDAHGQHGGDGASDGEEDAHSIVEGEPLRASTSSSMAALQGKRNSPMLSRSPSGIHVGTAKPTIGSVQTGSTPFPPLPAKQGPRRSRLGDPSPAFMRTRQPGAADVDVVFDTADKRIFSQPPARNAEPRVQVAALSHSVPPGTARAKGAAAAASPEDVSQESDIGNLSIAHSSAREADTEHLSPVLQAESGSVVLASPPGGSPVAARGGRASPSWLDNMADVPRTRVQGVHAAAAGWRSMQVNGSPSSDSSLETPRKARSVEVLSAPPPPPLDLPQANASTPLTASQAALDARDFSAQMLPDDLTGDNDELKTPEGLSDAEKIVPEPDEEEDEEEEVHVVVEEADEPRSVRPRTGYSEATATQLVDQTIGDVSFEASFQVPRLHGAGRHLLHTLKEDDADTSAVGIDSPLAVTRDPVSRPVSQRRVSELSDVSEFRPGRAEPVAATGMRRLRPSSQQGNGGFDSPAVPANGERHHNGGGAKAWETPADTRRLARDAPTKTAITRRVQELKIPAAELDVIRSSVAGELGGELSDGPDRAGGLTASAPLTVNESSQQIDVLQKENFELRLKIYFLEKQLGQETDLDKAALQRDNARLNVEGTKLAQLAQMREKRTKVLEKKVEELEYDKMRLQRLVDDSAAAAQAAESDGASAREAEHEDHVDELLDRIEDQEHHIRQAERQAVRAREELAMWIMRAEDAEARSLAQSRQGADPSADHVEGKHADREVLALRREIEKLESDLAVRTDDLHAARLKIADLDEELADYEAELNNADEEREMALEELADKADLERREFELYIEERHIEIDDLRERLREQEDGMASRIAEAIRPHEQAWRTVAADLGELEGIIADKEADWETERRLIEYQLDEVLEREKRLAEQLDAAQRDARAQTAKQRTLERDHADAEKKLQQLAKEYDEHIATTSEDLAREIKELKGDLAEAKSRAVTSGQALERAQQQTDVLVEQRRSLEVELDNVKENLRALRDDKEAGERELPMLRDELERHRQLCDELRSALDVAQAERQRAERIVAEHGQRQAEDEDVLRRQMAEDLARHDAAMETLQKELDDAVARAKAQSDELRDLHDAFVAGSDAEASMSADASLRDKLEKVFRDRDIRLDALRKELVDAGTGQEDAVLSLAAKAKLADGLEQELGNLRARVTARDEELDRLRRELAQREKQFGALNKALRQQHDDHDRREREAKLKEDKIGNGVRQVCDALEGLFKSLPVEERPDGQSLAKLVAEAQAVAALSPQSSPVRGGNSAGPANTRDGDSSAKLLAAAAGEAAGQIAQLGQRLRQRRDGAEADARKQVVDLQAVLAKRERDLAKLRDRVDELQRLLDDARAAPAHSRNPSNLRISLPPARRDDFRQPSGRSDGSGGEPDRPSSALVLSNDDRPHTDPTALARSSSRTTHHYGASGSGTGTDSAALLARIELLSRELKIVREKAVEEKLAGRARLAAQKKENARYKELLGKSGVPLDGAASAAAKEGASDEQGNGTAPSHAASTVSSRANASRTGSYDGRDRGVGREGGARSISPTLSRNSTQTAPPAIKVRRQ